MSALVKALLAAQRSLRGLEKDGSDRGRKYATVDGAVSVCREALLAQGLVLFPGPEATIYASGDLVSQEVEKATGVVREDKRPQLLYRRKWVLAHESGETRDLQAAAALWVHKGMEQDKAAQAADSWALLYLLRGLLLLPRGDEYADEAPFAESKVADKAIAQEQARRHADAVAQAVEPITSDPIVLMARSLLGESGSDMTATRAAIGAGMVPGDGGEGAVLPDVISVAQLPAWLSDSARGPLTGEPRARLTATAWDAVKDCTLSACGKEGFVRAGVAIGAAKGVLPTVYAARWFTVVASRCAASTARKDGGK